MKPLAFTPLFMERVWGGRALEGLGKALPAGQRVGESWEIVDRADAQSVLATGPHAGTGLNALWSGPDRERLFGARSRDAGDRFPILVKLLDARETLSVQVHPPASVAEELGGEPKNELWYLLGASEDAHLFAGLRSGVTRERFAATLEAGEDVSGLLHRIPVAEGDALFIPSGRVHAIGAGCLIVEIQQNSDTTYRVSDFDRPGLDGRPRELHVPRGARLHRLRRRRAAAARTRKRRRRGERLLRRDPADALRRADRRRRPRRVRARHGARRRGELRGTALRPRLLLPRAGQRGAPGGRPVRGARRRAPRGA